MHKANKPFLTIKEIAVFGMLGALMFASKLVTEAIPNVHLLGVFMVAETVVYRAKALFPIYVFVLIAGLFYGFATWWIPYLYIWAVLWGIAMLIPKRMPEWLKPIVYGVVCSLHGFLYGTLYAPAQVLLFFKGDFSKMWPWIVAGLPWDAVHGVSNLVCGMILIYPLVKLLQLSQKKMKY